MARFADVNLLQTPGAVIVPSSELASMLRGNLLKPGASVRLRFAGPWVIVAGVNDKLDFGRGGFHQAVIPAGIYLTAAALAAAIVAAMEAVDSTPVWACSYNAGTKKFTISSGHAFQLLFAPSTGDGIQIDIGYAMVDTVSATSHTAGEASYQSRHFVAVDMLAAKAFTVASIAGHNVSASGVVRMDADTTSLAAFALDAGAVSFTATLAGTDGTRSVTFASQSYRYIRLVVDDVQNPTGLNEVGVWFPGTYVESDICESIQFVERAEPLSEIHYANGGAHHQVLRGSRLVYSLEWLEILAADVDLFRALHLAVPLGTNFFLTLDAPGSPTVYGFLRAGFQASMATSTYFNVPLEFAEALG